jgi:preprotein translocase subunit SecB
VDLSYFCIYYKDASLDLLDPHILQEELAVVVSVDVEMRKNALREYLYWYINNRSANDIINHKKQSMT